MGADTDMLSGSIRRFVEQFAFADTYGSLMTVTAPADIDTAFSDFMPTFGLNMRQFDMMMKIYKILSQKYDVVCTNPPYMGGSGMNAKLSDFVKKYFPDSKSDLFATFIEKGLTLTKKNGFSSMVTMQSWMFLSSFENLRVKLLNADNITNLMHMENMVMGIAFGTAVSIFRNSHIRGYKGTYNHIKLSNLIKDEHDNDIPVSFPVMENRFAQVSTENFSKIPGMPVAYWVSENFVRAFENGRLLGEIASSKQGIATADNNRFLREWYEVNVEKILFDCSTHEESKTSPAKWYPYNKGGEFRKWYGNNDYVVNWQYDGAELRNFKKSVIRNPNFYFMPCFSWSLISSSVAAFRYKPKGHIFDVAGMSCFSNDKLHYLLALCNSSCAMKVLEVIAPTINYQCGDIANIPVIIPDSDEVENHVKELVKDNIDSCKTDWDYYEVSWDFEKHPLL